MFEVAIGCQCLSFGIGSFLFSIVYFYFYVLKYIYFW